MISLLVLSFAVVLGSQVSRIVFGRRNVPVEDSVWLWIALISIGVLLIGTLWDRRGRWTIPCLYLWGLTATLLCCDALLPFDDRAIVFGTATFAAYLMLTGLIYRSCQISPNRATQLGIADGDKALSATARWLATTNLVLGVPLLAISLVSVLFIPFSNSISSVAAFVPILLVASSASCCLLYTSPSPRDLSTSRMPSSA